MIFIHENEIQLGIPFLEKYISRIREMVPCLSCTLQYSAIFMLPLLLRTRDFGSPLILKFLLLVLEIDIFFRVMLPENMFIS